MSKKAATDATGYVSEEYDEQQQQFIWHAQNARSPTLSRLRTFLSSDNSSMINPSGDPTTNIYEKQGKCYNIPPHKINDFFRHLENCCAAKDFVLFTEKQLEPSGIMVDFDIYQDIDVTQFSTYNVHLLCTRLVEQLAALVNIDQPRLVWYVVVTKKPSVKYDTEKRAYKDGIHCIIPSVKLPRAAKKFYIERLVKEKVAARALKDVKLSADCVTQLADQPDRDGYIDTNSAHVPVFFYGCSTKKDEHQRISKPYELFAVYEASITLDTQDTPVNSDAQQMPVSTANTARRLTVILSDCKDRFLQPGCCTTHEFSINFEAPNGIIKKTAYQIAAQYAERIARISAAMSTGTQNLDQLERNMRGGDHQYQEVKEMLDILDHTRADRYKEWIEILWALANTSPKYKDLAEYFSRKSTVFKKADFERDWAQLSNNAAGDKRRTTIATVFYRARQDNPDRYAEIKKRSTMTIVTNRVHHKCNVGELGHADFAEILHKHVGQKFKTDYPPGSRTKMWYEFIDDADEFRDGELFKWLKHPSTPDSLVMYVTRELKQTMELAFDQLTLHAHDAKEENQKYYKMVHDNLRRSIRRLSDAAFIRNIISMATTRFSHRGFAERLDKDPLIRGVTNGVLRLSCAPNGRPELIEGYHDYAVSKYFPVPYIAFNPYDPDTAKILKLLRNLFAENEPDSYEFTMYYFSTTLDGLSKASLFMILYGVGKNGKTKLIELLRAALGDYCVKLPLSFLTSPNPPSSSATPDMAKLQSATMTTFAESKQGEILQAARVKEVTGGETIAARPLYGEYINFKPRSHFAVATNFEFTIEGDDYGTWRRILFNPFRIKFIERNDVDMLARYAQLKKDAHASGRPDPPLEAALQSHEKWSDPDMSDEWIESPQTAGRFLGILVWYHYWLHHNQVFKGNINNVPHPHIKYETDKYQARQNPIKEFLKQRLVKCQDPRDMRPLTDQVRIYQDWYTRHWRQTAPSSRVIIDQFKNSAIGNSVISTDRGDQLMGYRFLGEFDEKDPGETMGMPGDMHQWPEDNFGVPCETTEQFYLRICREYDQCKEIFSSGQLVAQQNNGASTLDTGAGQFSGGSGLNGRANYAACDEIPISDSDTLQCVGSASFKRIVRKDNVVPGIAQHAWDNARVDQYAAQNATRIEPAQQLIAEDIRILLNGRSVTRKKNMGQMESDELNDMLSTDEHVDQ